MKSVSAKDLTGDVHRRWAQQRRELYRSLLRDPRASEATKAQAKKKIEATKER